MTFLHAGQNQEIFDFHTPDSPGGGSHRDSAKRPVYIARSPAMKQIYQKIKRLALSLNPVLILGEEGTGKTATARQIFYENSGNKEGDFILIDARETDPDEMEKQLFDLENGLLSTGGPAKTLFIKNVDGLKAPLQEKLCQKLSQGAGFPRLTASADERIFDKSKGKELFHLPLFNILTSEVVILPPLSERREDIAGLIALFGKKSGSQWKPDRQALRILSEHSYRQNLNGLKAVCLKTALHIKTGANVSAGDLDLILKENIAPSGKIKYHPDMTLEDLIDLYIQMSLNHFRSKQKSASALGISVKTIYNKIKSGKVVF